MIHTFMSFMGPIHFEQDENGWVFSLVTPQQLWRLFSGTTVVLPNINFSDPVKDYFIRSIFYQELTNRCSGELDGLTSGIKGEKQG